MKLQLRHRGVPASQAVREHILANVEAAFGRRNRRIVHVTVDLTDAPAVRGSVAKHCRVVVQLAGGRVIRIDESEQQLDMAAWLALERAAAAVDRELEPRRDRQRGEQPWTREAG